MKKILITVGALALTLTFAAGCSSSTDTATPAPAPVVTQDPPVYPPAPSESDVRRQAFLAVIGQEFPTVDATTALQTGEAICQALGQGASLYQIGQTAIESGFTASQAGTLVGASVAGLCPEYQYLVDQLDS